MEFFFVIEYDVVVATFDDLNVAIRYMTRMNKVLENVGKRLHIKTSLRPLNLGSNKI